MAKNPVKQKLKKSVGNDKIHREKRKYTLTQQRRIKSLVIILGVVLLFSVFSISRAISNAVEVKAVLAEKQKALELAENKRKILESDLAKLDDSEYIAQFMRDEYLYTSDGEYLFILPEEEVHYENSSNVEESTAQND